MLKSEIIQSAIFRAKSPDKFNYQIELDKRKQIYKHARITSVKTHFLPSLNRNVTFIYYVPFNGNVNGFFNGLVSCCTLHEFKKHFKKLKFS